MKTIITIQHTQSVHHTNGMVGSWTDWELTETGIEQAKRIGEKLQAELGDRAKDFVLYSSDLLRAKQTAECVGKALHLTPKLRQELRERNIGRACGKSVQWLRENKECDEKNIDDKMFSDGESRRDEWKRLKVFFDEIMAGDDQNIIIVSHGDLLGVFNIMFLGLNVEALNTCGMHGAAGGVSVMVEYDDGKRIIKRAGDMSYVS